ncbi:MAG TPA: endonuclease/exonuclease/phosphatase family protein [Candidatus Hydrogenedentes bacterium]|jgi:endonuclease/exonuclease/phosphatase family metal-dependent hydrolase|nr:endonuclease/exonuclease/phosphatase family protein [Candidatus Hydrogenedentota bacterium]HOM48068.1 endonuclease/exonuclease/phosphatase family protein [Candidatus Hydrogenedentota bacterium]HOR50514.1 endonuclease/exonuclease/phosphatase family protein [Candidatus Hydrogenedentota bacterium]HPK25511.1 endonuclease/exonuclease/phosphatase family protein [Candidatus Hydrogenedentota bacterium]
MKSNLSRSTLFRRIGITLLLFIITAAAVLAMRWGKVIVETTDQTRSPFPSDAEEVVFTICTYNVQARPLFDETKNKFAHISPLLNRFDICALQECFKDYRRAWAAAEHSSKIFHGTLKHPLKLVGSGLSLLSSLPLISTDNINFDTCGEFQNRPASKGVLLGRYQAGAMTLDVYTTHIEAGGSPQALAARKGQGEEIVDFVNAQSPPENSVIILGDFNMRPSRGPEDKEKHKDNPKVYVFDWIKETLDLRDASDEFNGPVSKEIDRILFRPGKGCAMKVLHWQQDDPDFYYADGKTPLSDHAPLFARFQLERS